MYLKYSLCFIKCFHFERHFILERLLLSSFLPLLSPSLDFATVHTRCLWIWDFGTEQQKSIAKEALSSKNRLRHHGCSLSWEWVSVSERGHNFFKRPSFPSLHSLLMIWNKDLRPIKMRVSYFEHRLRPCALDFTKIVTLLGKWWWLVSHITY